jgi:DNA-binding response OmpR family regulator
VLTALVVDDATASRHRVATLLQLAGWQVLEVTDQAAAVRAAARVHPDLVVTELRLRSGNGMALAQQLRRAGCRARFLLVTSRPTAKAQTQAAAAGIAFLAKPVDPRQLIDFLRSRTTGPAAQDPRPRVRVTAERVATPSAAAASSAGSSAGSTAGGSADDEERSWRDRKHDFFVSALPHHLAMIAHSARGGDASAVASAAQTLAGESGQNGHPEVATMCHRIAEDARRGVLSQPRLMNLVTLASAAGAR